MVPTKEMIEAAVKAMLAQNPDHKRFPPTEAEKGWYERDARAALEAALAVAPQPVRVDEEKLAEVIWEEQESRVLNGYVIHTRSTAISTAAVVAEWLRGDGQ